jgi:8-oxo-dGTP diphosphatase
MVDEKQPCAVCGRWENRPATACAVIVRGQEVVLIRRGHEPGRGLLALPGGYIDRDETSADACRREVVEETGLEVAITGLVGFYDDPRRSPSQAISFAYLAEPVGGHLQPGDDADEAGWFPLDDLPELAFDHARIVADARRLLTTSPESRVQSPESPSSASAIDRRQD